MKLSGDDPLDLRPRGLNLTTGDLDVLRRLADAQREIGHAADLLFRMRTSKRAEREQLARRLNAVKASLRTVELRLSGEPPE